MDDATVVDGGNRGEELHELDYNEISVTAAIRVKGFPNANVISQNYN